MRRLVIGMTGASGAPYALCLMEELLRQGHEVHVTVTEAAWRVLKEEHGWNVERREEALRQALTVNSDLLHYHPIRDIGAPIASGSFPCDAMVVIPCSMGTLAKIAQGISSNLLERAADVMLKEGRPLIVVPRETPLNLIHLENMTKLARCGATVLPAMPAFYHGPRDLEDMVRFVAGKVLDQLNIPHRLYKRWEGSC
ncbi:4-hydroxy-3-polyprenylbenzoate decarboxylase [Planifilum fimeticola]|jgi:4-hydroxy-3-polyprenylbenzoate decarboxylase|uniref:Flavin prenyltransferase UbiX n=1 Tax=Planifilum fimeticola TaxID=201975 RepID=A0A2T0LDI1_9BACL|nr:flavin prenyltransferase UbiX [Planifilum fimeticola]PRX40079.1 4-hydroxy-3-polyprenylbenzoate decarboxylase [Planifilum fimeticola]